MPGLVLSLARALPAALAGAAVIAVALAGTWEAADSAGASARLSLLVAAIVTMAVCAAGLPRLARRGSGRQVQSDAVELGLLSGAALGVVVGGAVVMFALR